MSGLGVNYCLKKNGKEVKIEVIQKNDNMIVINLPKDSDNPKISQKIKLWLEEWKDHNEKPSIAIVIDSPGDNNAYLIKSKNFRKKKDF